MLISDWSSDVCSSDLAGTGLVLEASVMADSVAWVPPIQAGCVPAPVCPVLSGRRLVVAGEDALRQAEQLLRLLHAAQAVKAERFDRMIGHLGGEGGRGGRRGAV